MIALDVRPVPITPCPQCLLSVCRLRIQALPMPASRVFQNFPGVDAFPKEGRVQVGQVLASQGAADGGQLLGRAFVQGLPEATPLVQGHGSLKETPVFVFRRVWQLPKTCFFLL